MSKIKEILRNKWFKFCFWSILYILIFVVWSANFWAIFLEIFIYDYFISKKYKVLFWDKHTALKAKNSVYKFIMGWLEAIVFALVVASFIRTYFVEMYVIPSPSMEQTLLVGDYIGVSKVAYGPKMPNTPIAMPLVHNTMPFGSKSKSYVEWIQKPYERLAGYTHIKHQDVIVFNYPQGDTVLVESPQDNYYALKRQYGRKYLESISEIIYHPVDKRDNYIKRAIALAGDKLKIQNGIVYVNGKKEDNYETREYLYHVQFNPNTISKQVLDKLQIDERNIISYSGTSMSMFATLTQISKIKALNGVQNAVQNINQVPNIDVFPYDTVMYKNNEHNLEEITIPKRGDKIVLNSRNIKLYERLITAYENHTLETNVNGEFVIDGLVTKTYTIEMDYYWAMGDNRDNSLDSRFFGFVPEDHLVGKANFIWFSTDMAKSFPKNIRFDRIFNWIK